ncbi:hypothetical protein RDI58_010599 [Solanum bulbocastanum]|uniref:Uncharacterized protein n=1 Tax=Solanum bulbocastanum TaxID=147425 RepID=A0AAN8YJM6_SOLBU
MKRVRDDSPFGFSHRDLGDSDVDRAGASKPKMMIDETFSYLNQVKDKFANQREKYITFFVVMMDFMSKRLSLLLKDHLDLLEEIKVLLERLSYY